MTYEAFTPKTDVEEFLNHDFNIEIFEHLTEDPLWQNLFDPLTFFNLFYTELDFILANKHKPLTVTNRLLALPLSDLQRLYLLWRMSDCLMEIEEEAQGDKELDILGTDFIFREYEKLKSRLFPAVETQESASSAVNRYDFKQVKQHLETLAAVKDKVRYLIEIKTEYLQTNPPLDDQSTGVSFDQQCQLEIKKLNTLLSLENDKRLAEPETETKARFKLTDKRGAKTDLIRILAALYDLRFIEKPNGEIPTKQEFFNAFGEFLGTDLKHHQVFFSQSIQGQSLQANLEVFENMKKFIQKAHFDGLNSK